ncbi:hypothetical protein Hanom_Chr08g00690801 [Helianthus anomalus]
MLAAMSSFWTNNHVQFTFNETIEILKLVMLNQRVRFGQFCDFRPKLCFSASGSRRFKILPFSSNSLTPSIFSSLSQRYFRLFC